jgi:flagellar basal-body rod protein FlgC
MDIAGSALTAQRLRMDVISSNVANAETTRTPSGGPYRRAQVVFSPTALAARVGSRPGETSSVGVEVQAIAADEAPPRMVHDPNHPDADEQGNVAYPNVDVTTEMVDMLSATRAYEASVTVLNASKSMAMKSLEIGRG